MLLAVDIGNSNIVLAIWDGRHWSRQWRLETLSVQNEGRYAQHLNHLFDNEKLQRSDISSIIMSSVVPAATQLFLDALHNLFQPEPFVLKATSDTGILIETDHPGKVGTDLIADAVAGYRLIKDTCIVVDFGTATTVMAVQNPGALQGVAICAGLKASKDSLVAKAAQLFDMPLKPPSTVLGKNTIEAMQSGLVVGHICMVEGLVGRMKQEIGPAKVIATGGLAEMLAPLTFIFDRVEPMLTLDGLRIIAERQQAGGSSRRQSETAE